MASRDHVSKVRITVRRDGEAWVLLSRKRAPRHPEKHDKLEMLGGHVDPGESPLEALVRELAQEEHSGVLSEKAKHERPAHRELDAGGARHFLFEMAISEQELARLEPGPEESLGFEVVRAADLDGGGLDDELTPRTRKILAALAETESEP